jgi:hypothetical protein
VYIYVDDEGTTIFTEQLQSIPERYRERVQVMSKAEEERLERQAKEAKDKKTGTPQPSKQMAAASEPAQEAEPEAAPGPASLTAFLPPLSDYQKAVLGMGFGLAVILFVMMKMSRSFAVRLLLRLVLVAVLFGTSYLVYFSGLGEKFAEMTGQGGKDGAKAGAKFQSPTELLKQAREAAQQMQKSQQDTVNLLQQMEKE